MKTTRKKKDAPLAENPDIHTGFEAQPGLSDEERFMKLEEAVNRRIDELLGSAEAITPGVVKDTLTMIQTMRSLRPEFLGRAGSVISWEKEEL